MFEKMRSFFTWRRRLEERQQRWEDIFYNSFQSMHMSLDTTSRSMSKVSNELRRVIDKQEILRTFVGSIETAGIRRKFGGVIEVEYDKFLNAIGPIDELELEQTIKERKGKGVSAITKKKKHRAVGAGYP